MERNRALIDAILNAAEVVLDLDEIELSTSGIEVFLSRVEEKMADDGWEMTEQELRELLPTLREFSRERAKRAEFRKQGTALLDRIAIEIENLPNDPTWDSIDPHDYHVKLGKILGLQSQFLSIGAKCGFVQPVESEIKVEQVRAIYVDLGRSITEVDRKAKLDRRHAARKPDLVVEVRRCSCGKPAKLDGLCKKCARASGIIVHGKIA